MFQYFWRFARNLLHLLTKLFLFLWWNCSETITKTILRANAANFLQICVNLQKYWNNVMSNYGLNIGYMDLSHIHLAVPALLLFRKFYRTNLPVFFKVKNFTRTFLVKKNDLMVDTKSSPVAKIFLHLKVRNKSPINGFTKSVKSCNLHQKGRILWF